jgi:hypothetical protein
VLLIVSFFVVGDDELEALRIRVVEVLKSAAEKRGDAQAIAVVQGDVHLARDQPVIPHTQWNGRNRPTRNFAVTANGSRGQAVSRKPISPATQEEVI